MKNARKRFQRSAEGYALLVTMVFVGITLLVLGSVMEWTNSSAQQTMRNNLYSMGTAAAEATDERVISQMMRDFNRQTYNAPSDYTGLTADTSSWPVQFSFSNPSNTTQPTYINGTANWTTNWIQLGSPYAGDWASVVQTTVISTATANNQSYSVPATVEEDFQLAAIPITQYAIFYDMDMEISPGQDMTVNGKTYVMGKIWASPGGHLIFGDTVQCTGNYTHGRDHANDPQSDGGGAITFNVGGGAQTNAPPLIMPVGTNSDGTGAQAILGLPPTGTDPDSQAGQSYLYNTCDLIISNASTGVISTYFQDTNNVSRLTLIPPDLIITNGSGTNITYSTNYSFVGNTNFYDYREKKTVQAVELNVGALNTWLAGANGSTYNTQDYTDTGHYIRSAYVYNNATASSTQLPAVRMANGSVLPTQGFTVATPDPLYVLGNYNATGAALGTTNTLNSAPAGLMGDAITVLSTSWRDTYTSGTGLSSRNAGSTTVNAATFEGIVVSTNFGGTKYFSGGVENFLRLLEDWGGDTLTYNGSIIVMFASQYATNYWQSPGVYYQVPTRKWGFDMNYTQLNKLPPAFPQVRSLVRQSWKAY